MSGPSFKIRKRLETIKNLVRTKILGDRINLMGKLEEHEVTLKERGDEQLLAKLRRPGLLPGDEFVHVLQDSDAEAFGLQHEDFEIL